LWIAGNCSIPCANSKIKVVIPAKAGTQLSDACWLDPGLTSVAVKNRRDEDFFFVAWVLPSNTEQFLDLFAL
jgi:hypothetical protein